MMKCSIMLHFIWAFTVCKSTCLGVSRIQRVDSHLGLHYLQKYSSKYKRLTLFSPFTTIAFCSLICLYMHFYSLPYCKLYGPRIADLSGFIVFASTASKSFLEWIFKYLPVCSKHNKQMIFS